MNEYLISKGQVISFRNGFYDLEHGLGTVIAIKDFNLKNTVREFSKTLENNYDDSGLVPHLIALGLVLPLDVLEIHLGGQMSELENY